MATKLGEQPRRGHLVERRWDARREALGGRSARRGFTYHAYVPDEIADDDFLLSSHVAAAAANAEKACLDLNENASALVNLEGLARQLLRAESVASSRIEGLVLSHRRLAKAAFADDSRDLTVQGVLASIAALERAVALAGGVTELTRDHLLEVHRARPVRDDLSLPRRQRSRRKSPDPCDLPPARSRAEIPAALEPGPRSRSRPLRCRADELA